MAEAFQKRRSSSRDAQLKSNAGPKFLFESQRVKTNISGNSHGWRFKKRATRTTPYHGRPQTFFQGGAKAYLYVHNYLKSTQKDTIFLKKKSSYFYLKFLQFMRCLAVKKIK